MTFFDYSKEQTNTIYRGFVIGPSTELIPPISIAPLDRHHFISDSMDSTPKVDNYLKNRFGSNYHICLKAREALTIVLKELDLKRDDVVTIFTTTGSLYISGCVTRTIEKVCKWSREITSNTRVILVNHEFGYAYPDVSRLKMYGLPIIEDCAHSFFTDHSDIGQVGDYVIYSLPKAFSIQLGGILVSKHPISYKTSGVLSKYVKSALESQVDYIEDIVSRRLLNYHSYLEELKGIGVSSFFELKDGDVPGVFIFKIDQPIDLVRLKAFMNENGVDSSVFYGQEAFFVPVHQNLTSCEISYICSLLSYFVTENC